MVTSEFGAENTRGTNVDAGFGTLLRRLRLAAGLSQEDLAERSGISAQAISTLERGSRRHPRRDTLSLLAAALELTPADRAAFLAAANVRGRERESPARPPLTPAAPTTLIGREAEVERVCALLASPEVRLLTLTGPGGVGKTRLALAVAAALQQRLPGRTFLVPLAALRDPGLVLSAIAQSMGIQDSAAHGLEDLVVESLRRQPTLIVLDNVEHLPEAATLLAELLIACPRLTILATSRAALHIQAEQQYAVPPLALPAEHTLAAATQSPAVRLFVRQARMARPDFALTADNAQAIAAICRRLDGLPLAIELAAARIKLLPPKALLSRLGHALTLLTGGGQDRPERHQTMRAAIAWSYELLTMAEQALFRRLAVFAGGYTLEAMESVCGVAPSQIGTTEREGEGYLLDWLGALVDSSLVRQEEETDDELRFGMLETAREYGLERLAAAGEEAAAVAERHAAYFLALAEDSESALRGPGQARGLAQLEREHDNLRVALAWATAQRPDWGLRLAASLCPFWITRGHLTEGRRWLDGALAAGTTAPAESRAAALVGAGGLARLQYDYARAAELIEAGLALQRELGDRSGEARALIGLANLAWSLADYGRAASLYEQSLALRRELGDRLGMATALSNLGLVANVQGDYARAEARYREALVILRAMGDTGGIAKTLQNLGISIHAQLRHKEAIPLYRESLDLFERLGDKEGIRTVLIGMGVAAADQGEYEQAQALHEQGLALARELQDSAGAYEELGHLAYVHYLKGDYTRAISMLKDCLLSARSADHTHSIAVNLERLAQVIWALGRAATAARLFGAAHSLRQTIGVPLPPRERDAYQPALADLQRRLGDETFAAAWRAGQAIGIEEIVAEALAVEP